MRWKIWFFDIFPGFLDLKVSAIAIMCYVFAVFCALATENLMQSMIGFNAVVLLPAATLAGMAAIMLVTSGLLFLLYGKVGNPLSILFDLSARHWVALLTLLLLSIGLFGFTRTSP